MSVAASKMYEPVHVTKVSVQVSQRPDVRTERARIFVYLDSEVPPGNLQGILPSSIEVYVSDSVEARYYIGVAVTAALMLLTVA